ncbi:MAG: preprotein translocase subunit SecG [Deltaproteobacteria bacterium]|nr:preprotein translocase subunit SecG [Deltaproteobacteria bacterium]
MFTTAIIIHIIASIVLIIAVLLQVGKGATMGSSFGGASSQTVFGSAGPTTFLAKITSACAVIFMLTSLFLTYSSSKQRSSSIMSKLPSVAPAAKPASPAGPPQGEAPAGMPLQQPSAPAPQK